MQNKEKENLLSNHIWIKASTGYGMTSPIIRVSTETEIKEKERFKRLIKNAKVVEVEDPIKED